MPFAAALSQHPGPADATAEVVGQLLERDIERPDLAVLFCSPHHVEAFAEIVSTVQTLLQPERLVGATAVAVIGGRHEVEDGPALSLWAATLGSVPAPVRLTALSTGSGVALQGLPRLADDHRQTVLLLADPFTLPVPDVLDVLAASHESAPVIGGLASGGLSPGSNRLALDGEVFTDGAVGVVIGGLGAPRTVVSQGCRPVGAPMIVTKAEGNHLIELAGRGALSRLEQVASQVSPDERELMGHGGVHLGIVADEHRVAFERGDFLVRSVIGADRERGALTVGAVVEVGTTVQFHVRDAATADDDLRGLLATQRRADGALVFTCNGRGRHLFGTADHDAALVSDMTAGQAVAGMFCAGEIGPVGRRSFMHGFTACVLLFEERPGRG